MSCFDLIYSWSARQDHQAFIYTEISQTPAFIKCKQGQIRYLEYFWLTVLEQSFGVKFLTLSEFKQYMFTLPNKISMSYS